MKQKPSKIDILKGKEQKEIFEKLKNQFGIKNVNGTLFMRGKERVFLYSGNLDEKDIRKIEEISFIERIGVYLGKIERDEIRLSIEGTQILKDQLSKNIVELTKEEMETWMMGHEVRRVTGFNGFVVMMFNSEPLGCGKASAEKITNFIPKSRRLKDKSIVN